MCFVRNYYNYVQALSYWRFNVQCHVLLLAVWQQHMTTFLVSYIVQLEDYKQLLCNDCKRIFAILTSINVIIKTAFDAFSHIICK